MAGIGREWTHLGVGCNLLGEDGCGWTLLGVLASVTTCFARLVASCRLRMDPSCFLPAVEGTVDAMDAVGAMDAVVECHAHTGALDPGWSASFQSLNQRRKDQNATLPDFTDFKFELNSELISDSEND